MAGQEINSCSVCSCEFTDDEGGIQGNFGMLPVSFCPTCFSSMCDMADQYRDPEAFEEEANPDYDLLIQHLRGVQKIVINTCYGGFGMRREAVIDYLDRSGTEYVFAEQPDRERQFKLGHKIMVAGREFNESRIERDDPALVNTVEALGERVNSDHSDLKVVVVPAGINWTIQDYDGREWVAEIHRTWN